MALEEYMEDRCFCVIQEMRGLVHHESVKSSGAPFWMACSCLMEYGKPQVWTVKPFSVKSIAGYPDAPWEQVTQAEGSKVYLQTQRFIIHVVSCREDGNRNCMKPGEELWLYIRKYEDGTIKYFVSNAPGGYTLYRTGPRSNVEVAKEYKCYLGMTHYGGCSYPGWIRHVLFVMIAHLFTTQIRKLVKKGPADNAYGSQAII